MELSNIVNTFETDFLKIIIRLLKSGELPLDEAKEITKEFLAFLPFKTYEELRDRLKGFTDKYEYIRPAYLSVMKIEEDKKMNGVLNKMRGLMKENKVDEALDLVK